MEKKVNHMAAAVRRRDLRVHRDELAAQLWEAWTRDDSAEIHKITRKLAGPLGPKKRKYNVPMQSQPSKEEWRDYLTNPASEGGFSGHEYDWEAFHEQINTLDGPGSVTEEQVSQHWKAAGEDMRELKQQFRNAMRERCDSEQAS